MDAVEKQVVKDLLHQLVDREMATLINDEAAKVPAPYGQFVQLILVPLIPAIQAKLDAAIDAATA